MVRKKLAVAILALSALQANFAEAMGLGNLSVKSALNQPLNAEIKLLDVGDLDSSQIKIQLASPEDFQRAGVDRDFFLTNLRFDVAMDGRGGATIRVTTREPVVEPYLNFVIEARWPNGRLLREFAVLLDPPTFSAGKAAAPVTPATSSTAQPVKPRAVQPPAIETETEVAKSAPAGDLSLPAANKPGEYRVQVYDTLSKIAARSKPANDVSVAQTMIAIQRANPDAFIRNNVNLIKSGAVLRLPSADDVRSVTAEQAAQDVEMQAQEWRGGRSSGSTAARAPAAGPQLDASAPEPSKKEGGYREQARLSIATSGDTDKNAGGGGSPGKGVEALRQQLTDSQEALEKGKRDNKEMQSRLDDMERQIATLQRLISLKDDQLAALQAKSADSKPAAQQAPAPAAEQAATPASAGSESATTATPATPVPPPQAAPKPVAAAPKPAVKPATPAAEGDSFAKLIVDRYYYLGGGLVAILAALGIPLLIKRQRRKAWEDRQGESESLSFETDDHLQFDTAAFDAAGGEAESPEAEVFAPDADKPAQPAADAAKKTVRSETGDPIAESDIYIAYGRYQQAVDLLTNAIDAEPSRSDLRTKLLEVYVEMRNKDAFRQQFVALQGLGDSDAVARVKDLLSSVDGISDWIDGLPGASSISTPAAAVATAAVTAAAAAAPDLDLDFGGEPEAAASAAVEVDLSDDLAALETSFADERVESEESPAELDLNLDDELLLGEADTELPEDFLGESESTFSVADSVEASEDHKQEPMGASALEMPSFESAPAEVTAAPAHAEEELELDLGDDDLDAALSSMGAGESLDDLEDMSKALGDLETPAAEEALDLGADFDTLPEEFDLSQTSTELSELAGMGDDELADLSFEEPFVESGDGSDSETDLGETGAALSGVGTELAGLGDAGDDELVDLSFEEPFVELGEQSESATQPEMDVFAGLNTTSPVSVAEQPAVEAPVLEGGDDFDFLADADEIATKLDLARAYIDMGDTDGARDILDEVMQEGTDTQKQEASTLLSRIG